MKSKSSYKFFLMSVFVIATVTQLHAQSIVGTCTGRGQRFATIAAAVTGTPTGSTIFLCPGIYPEQVVITRRISLIGLETANPQGSAFTTVATQAVITAPAAGLQSNGAALADGFPVAAQILVKNITGVTLSNFAVDGANNGIPNCATDLQGIYFQNASGTIDHVAVRNEALTTFLDGCQSGEGIYAESGAGRSVSTVQITNNSVHGYQKNGITVTGNNMSATVQGNIIWGQGPTTGAAENGVQISDGATATVSGNVILDNVYIPPAGTLKPTGGAGILVYSADSITVSNNRIGNSQIPIVTIADPAFATPINPRGSADKMIISGNTITNSSYGDGIDACSNYNIISGNLIVNTLTSGIHLDSTCGTTANPTGIFNQVTSNTINESCAGVLGATANPKAGNLLASNVVYNVQVAALAGDVCTSTLPAATTTATAALFSINSAPATIKPVRR